MRTVMALVGLVSFATLLAEGVAVGVLAVRGQLSSEAVSTIGAVLSGRTPQAAAAEAPAPPPVMPSAEEIEAARTLKTLELNARADELRLLKDMLTAEAEQLKRDRTAYEQARAEFEKRLAELGARNVDEATERTRAVVKAMPPEEAVAYLLPLPELDVVRVLKGLPERTTAKILQQFAAGTDEERQRGHAVFTAISDGKPETEVIKAAEGALDGSAAGDAAP